MYSAAQLCLCSIPVLSILEGNVRGSVVHHGESAHPEMVSQPGHEPELEKACDTRGVYEGREDYCHEAIHGC